MLKKILTTCAVVACLGFPSRGLWAQSVVHALTGTVSAIDPDEKTITLFLDGGSQGTFRDMTNAKAPLSFDKRILAESTSVDAFKKKGAYVIVFYFGGRDTRTAVALRSLGAGPFTATDGTVSQFGSHDRSITVEDKSGAVQTYRINSETVGEGTYGAVDGLKFSAQKGDHVRVVGTSENGASTALFISEM
jgi:hypothetical protein